MCLKEDGLLQEKGNSTSDSASFNAGGRTLLRQLMEIQRKVETHAHRLQRSSASSGTHMNPKRKENHYVRYQKLLSFLLGKLNEH